MNTGTYLNGHAPQKQKLNWTVNNVHTHMYASRRQYICEILPTIRQKHLSNRPADVLNIRIEIIYGKLTCLYAFRINSRWLLYSKGIYWTRQNISWTIESYVLHILLSPLELCGFGLIQSKSKSNPFNLDLDWIWIQNFKWIWTWIWILKIMDLDLDMDLKLNEFGFGFGLGFLFLKMDFGFWIHKFFWIWIWIRISNWKWIWIWTWMSHCYGFGFGFGFTL